MENYQSQAVDQTLRLTNFSKPYLSVTHQLEMSTTLTGVFSLNDKWTLMMLMHAPVQF